MTLRELISKIQEEEIIDSNSITNETLDKEIHFLDMDDNKRSMNFIKEKVCIANGVIEIELHSIGEICSHV